MHARRALIIFDHQHQHIIIINIISIIIYSDFVVAVMLPGHGPSARLSSRRVHYKNRVIYIIIKYMLMMIRVISAATLSARY